MLPWNFPRMRPLLSIAAGLPLLLRSLFAQAPNDPQIALGKKLFFDTRMSADGTVSCASCHRPEHAFADVRVRSTGVFERHGNRHSPSLLGRASGTLQFWDGRSASLEEQVIEPIRNPAEMDTTIESAVARLRADPAYRELTVESLPRALALYVRTIRSVDSPFDRFLTGSAGGLSDLEREGLRLFRDRARCYICHAGNNLSDEMFHNTGVAWRDGKFDDPGRAGVTGKPSHQGAFKTPTLREIAITAPYMHDGSIATLEEVIDFYDGGGNANPNLDENLVPLHLSKADKQALLAFLRALSGSIRDGN
ncbi:MAG: cytochrome-c peroxidase [Acidobacteriota bacterium]|nr:cytochrome-c peroxidase [Acidobacteriota bacterium]